MIADELRRQADQFIDLADLEPIIARDGAAKPARNARSARGHGGAEHGPADYPDADET